MIRNTEAWFQFRKSIVNPNSEHEAKKAIVFTWDWEELEEKEVVWSYQVEQKKMRERRRREAAGETPASTSLGLSLSHSLLFRKCLLLCSLHCLCSFYGFFRERKWECEGGRRRMFKCGRRGKKKVEIFFFFFPFFVWFYKSFYLFIYLFTGVQWMINCGSIISNESSWLERIQSYVVS